MNLAPWIDEARALQRDTFVFDYAPCGEPILMTPRHHAAMLDGLERRLSVGHILAAMTRDRLDEIMVSTALRDRIRSCWAQSGVDAVQITLGGRVLAPQIWEACIDDIGHWLHRARAGGDMAVCASADELVEAHATRRIGLMLGLQDSGVIGTDLARLDLLYRMGLRVAQLTYNTRNAIGDGCEERAPSGLSKFGITAVHRMNTLGIVVDVSHCGHATTMDAIALSRAPVAVTHACCHAVASHPRAKTDDVLRALRDTNGFFGIVTVPKFLDPQGRANLDVWLRHVDHALDILGPDNVGIATDWGGWTPDLPPELVEAATENFRKLGFKADTSPEFGVGLPEFGTWESWPNLTAGLLAAGHAAGDVRRMIGGNWLAFTRRVEAARDIT